MNSNTASLKDNPFIRDFEILDHVWIVCVWINDLDITRKYYILFGLNINYIWYKMLQF